MGIAAYNRGTALVSRQLDESIGGTETERHNAEVVSRINSLPRGKRSAFDSTVIRVDHQGFWWIMDQQDEGWASFGYYYSTLKALLADWNMVVTGFGRDSHSFFYNVENAR